MLKIFDSRVGHLCGGITRQLRVNLAPLATSMRSAVMKQSGRSFDQQRIATCPSIDSQDQDGARFDLCKDGWNRNPAMLNHVICSRNRLTHVPKTHLSSQ